MRESGTWMTIWDDRILEYLRENEGATVGELTDSESIRVSNAHVSRRCKKLAEHGLLTPIGNGAYVITDVGKAYLDEEYDAENEVFLNQGNSSSGPSASETSES
ncbi:winged helix-turn-helix domain-containing protein [Halostagnicola larsenii]|uniref:winged helix-turn-helix domain-containing protein n=1 Tax=Halostagnicola larsenii TaxID=353800 RepID=UPI000A00BBFD|nr:winged helix-turn-helix domain-containing protein [Halostagnicola larsenii]